ncbi:MAG: hypothetical protein ACI4MO_06315 [Christensenellales bacterium]
MKLDKTIYKETAYIAIWTLIFSALMNAVFLVIKKWDLTVLWGNLLSFAGGVLNFFLLGVTVQKALNFEEKKAKNAMKLSQSLRLLMTFVIAVVGVVLKCFNTVAVLVPLIFPRIAIAMRPLFDKKLRQGGEVSGNGQDDSLADEPSDGRVDDADDTVDATETNVEED